MNEPNEHIQNGLYSEENSTSNIRIIDIAIKKQVIERAMNICGHCGKEFKPWEKENEVQTQICHIKRHADGGPFTADNLIYGHRKCDGLYDGGSIIHDPDFGITWLEEYDRFRRPDIKQLNEINPEFIRHRWNWEKTRRGYCSKTDDEFREILKSESYSHICLFE